jgi:chromosome segregation ATPase
VEGRSEGAERILEGLAQFRDQLSRGAVELEAALARLSFYQRFDEEVRRPIEEAHKLAEEIKRRAEEEASAILREARLEAEALKAEIVKLTEQIEQAAREAEAVRIQAEDQVRRRLAAVAEEEASVLSRLANLKDALENLGNRFEEEERRAKDQAQALLMEARRRAEVEYDEQIRKLGDTKRKLEEEIRELQLVRQQIATDLERALVERLAAIRQHRLSTGPVGATVLFPGDAHPARVAASVVLLALAAGPTQLGYPRLQNDVVALPVAGESPQLLLQKLQAAAKGPLPFRAELKPTGEIFLDLSVPARVNY